MPIQSIRHGVPPFYYFYADEYPELARRRVDFPRWHEKATGQPGLPQESAYRGR